MSLLAPLFLLGLLAAAIPLLVHRLQEQHAPVKDFPSSRFLEETRKNTSRRRKLRYRWLLAARIALLALLSALFAEPILNLAKKFLGDNGEQHIVMLDDSFSMRHGDRWQDALEIASDLVDEHSGSADISFLLASGRALQPGAIADATDTLADGENDTGAQVVSSESSLESELEFLQTLEPTITAIDYSQIMDAVDRVAERFLASEKPVFVHLISDLQRSAARVSVNRLYRETIEGFELHRVGADSDSNVSLGASASWINPSTARVDTEIRWSRAIAKVVAAGSDGSNNTQQVGESAADAAPTSTVQVQVVHGNDILAEESIELVAGETRRKAITVSGVDDIARRAAGSRAGDDGGLPLSVNIVGSLVDSDLLLDDNQVQLKLPDNSPLRVAVYAADPLRQQRDLAYIDAAYRQMHNVEVQVIDSRAGQIPEQTDLLIALHAAGERDVTAAVEEFRRNGGAVLQVLGGSFFSANDTSQFGQSASIDDQVTRVDLSHPLGLGAGGGRADWLDVSVSRVVWRESDLADAMQLLDGSKAGSSQSASTGGDENNTGAENQSSQVFDTSWLDGRFRVLLATQSGVPLLMQAFSKAGSANSESSASIDNNGTGNSQPLTSGWLVLAVPLDGITSNLPVSPVFVPFLHQLTEYLLQQGRYPAVLSAGNSLMLAANTQLLSPQGESVFDFASNSRRRSYLFDEPGTYTILEPRGTHQIQVGIEAAESDVQVLSKAALEQWQIQYGANTNENEANSITAADDGSDDSTTSSNEASNSSATQIEQVAESRKQRQLPLWQWLLPLLLVLLLIEAITANRVLQRFRASV